MDLWAEVCICGKRYCEWITQWFGICCRKLVGQPHKFSSLSSTSPTSPTFSDLLLHPKVTPVTDPLPGSMEVVFTPPRRGLYEVQAWHSGVLVRYLPALVTVT